MNNWYALFVKTGHEESVQQYIQYHFDCSIRTIIPKRKIMEKREGTSHHVLKKLFPGYVFLNAELDTQKYYTIKHIPKLIKFLGNGAIYSPIDEEEIAVILGLTGSGEIIDYSTIYVENSMVYVKEGPLKGFEGMIKKIDKHARRAKVQFYFMGEPRLLDLGIQMLY